MDIMDDAGRSESDRTWAGVIQLIYAVISAGGVGTWMYFNISWFSGCQIGIVNYVILLVFVVFFYFVGLQKVCGVYIFRQ